MDLNALADTLRKHRYTVTVCRTGAEAVEHLVGTIRNETVGFGGSVTLRDIGLYEELADHNNMIWHWRFPDARAQTHECTAYVSSVNAIAMSGEMVNIDGTGNRIAATVFGPKKVFFVVGRNKVAPDLPSAIDRARNVASPLNCERLELKNPCVKAGKCLDCSSPERACNAMTIYLRPMMGMEHTEVVLVDEDLGF